jgi:hypothetical protein
MWSRAVWLRSTGADLTENSKEMYEEQYSMGDAKRGLWNRFGIVLLGVGFLGIGAMRSD